MISPWVIGNASVDETAARTAANSCGWHAQLQFGIASVLAEHLQFGEERVPIVLEAVGDYISEMNRLISSQRLTLLVKTPESRWAQASRWDVTAIVQAFETPVVNRVPAGEFVTALRACELAAAVLYNRQVLAGSGPFRLRSIAVIQSGESVSSYALTGSIQHLVSIETT